MHVSTKKEGRRGRKKAVNKGGEKRGPGQTPYFTSGKLKVARVSLGSIFYFRTLVCRAGGHRFDSLLISRG